MHRTCAIDIISLFRARSTGRWYSVWERRVLDQCTWQCASFHWNV